MKYLTLSIAILFSLIVFGQNKIVEEDILVMNDSIQLPGTLTYAKDVSEQPLVIFVHGSGNVDRNGNQAMMNVNPNYIKLLNDSLVAKGIAFFRYDKRTATPDNLEHIMSDLRFDGFLEDINKVITHFKDDDRFSSITLIGHSQGSLVAMLADHSNIDNYISLAGISNNFDKTLVEQVRTQNGEDLANLLSAHFKELRDDFFYC